MGREQLVFWTFRSVFSFREQGKFNSKTSTLPPHTHLKLNLSGIDFKSFREMVLTTLKSEIKHLSREKKSLKQTYYIAKYVI